MWKWLWRMINSAPDCVLINDPKKLFRKKLYVTIPQWSETFPSMSDLSSGHNSAKCGLQLKRSYRLVQTPFKPANHWNGKEPTSKNSVHWYKIQYRWKFRLKGPLTLCVIFLIATAICFLLIMPDRSWWCCRSRIVWTLLLGPVQPICCDKKNRSRNQK